MSEPITDAELAALDAAVEQMTPGPLHMMPKANCLGTWTVFIGPGEYGSNQLCATNQQEEASCIVALRNSYAALRERLRVAEAERDAEREACAKIAESHNPERYTGGRLVGLISSNPMESIAVAIRSRSTPSETHP